MTTQSTQSDRDFDEQVRIDATPEQVWAVLADPTTMPQASPELFALTRRRKGPFRAGETFIGWNRRRAIVWPTISTVTKVSPGQELSWHTKTSGAVWTYTLTSTEDGTILRERRTMPSGAPSTVRVFADTLLGGMSNHADELERHVAQTLHWIKLQVEA